MEIRAFAESVLFASTLADKLRDPGPIPLTDACPGPALDTPAAPGRPPNLRFKPIGSGKAAFPGTRQLQDSDERGRLLHYFANHELLATELMALALLRFPDAPPAFRRGLLQTLRDEQEHTRLYLARMRTCGIDFGDIPVSGYFWRAVSPMVNPIDYVASLSLTFEQANLDYSRHFAAAFQDVGDSDSAALLERIYRDEIGHVAYGLKWFRRWKNPNESDWVAFCHHLRFPLSPQRAKGFSVNAEGRRAAGLDPAFIAELEVYSQSRGRTPTLFLFNPFAEASLDLGPAFTPGKHQAALARDLATLPQFLARPDDAVLVPRRPRVEFLATLKHAGFPLPEFVELPTAGNVLHALESRKIGRLRPWAWAPDSLAVLSPLFPQVTGEPPPPFASSPASLARLHGKPWSAALLHAFLHRSAGPTAHSWSDEPWVCPATTVGRTAASFDEVLAIIGEIRARGHHRIVVKQALGLAGAGAIRLWEPDLLESQRRWIHDAVAYGRNVVVEPWLDRIFDFSIQLEHGVDGLRLLGFTTLVNDPRGQFLANAAAPDHARRPPSQVGTLLASTPPAPGPPLALRLQHLFTDLLEFLSARLGEAGHRGPAGIDAFVYRDAQGNHRLKPIVEINPRHTMGRVTLELMSRACPGTHGSFHLLNHPALRRAGHGSFQDLAQALATRHPLVLEGSPIPRIRSGAIPLTDPASAEVCLAVFQVTASHPHP